MPSVRTSFSLDAVRDHELIEWLAELQADGQASDVIRTALNEHRQVQVTLNDVMIELQEIKEMKERLQQLLFGCSPYSPG